MSVVAQVALVSDTANLDPSELTNVAAALQKQISRDLIRFWDLDASISAFVRLEDVPPGYWPIIVRDDIDNTAAGVHCDNSGQPVALVTFDSNWSVTASHEMLEMLVDPFGNRLIAGQSLKPDQGRVEYLVEISDPIGDNTYPINDVIVSDFITPRFFDPIPSAGVQYNYADTLKKPRTLLPNGYITWHDPVAGIWWQQSRINDGAPTNSKLGPLLKNACGMRSTVDRLARQRRPKTPKTVTGKERAIHERRLAGMARSKQAKASAWRQLIAEIRTRQL